MADAKLNIIITAKDQTRGAIKSLGTSLQGIGKFALVGAGAAAAGIAAVGVGVVKLAKDAASLETVQAAFEGITEASGESADAMLEALRKQSAGMITNADLMTSYNKAAQLVGTTFANELPDAMGMVGKVAASTGQDMGFLMDSLVTGIGRLSPMILDNLGIQVDLTQAYEDYAAANGLVASEMSKTEQQAALMEQVMMKLRDNTASMPEVAGSAAASFESFKVTLQNTKDQIGLALIPVVQPLMEKLGQLATTILPPLIDLFNTYMVPALQAVGNALSLVVGFIAKFVDALKAGADPMTAFNYAAHQMFPPEVASRIIEIKDRVVEFVDKVREALQPVITFIQENVEMQDVLIALAAVIAAVIIPAIASIIASIAPLIAIFVGLVAIIAVVRKAWEENWGGIQEKTEAVLEFIKGILQNYFDVYSRIFEAFRLAFQGDWEGFGAKLREAWDIAWQKIKDIFNNAIEWIKNYDWSSLGRNIIDGIVAGIKAVGSRIGDAIRGFIQGAKDSVVTDNEGGSPFMKWAREVGVPMVEGIIVGIESMEGELDDKIKSLFDVGNRIGGIGGGFASFMSKDLQTYKKAYESWQAAYLASQEAGQENAQAYKWVAYYAEKIRKEEERITKLKQQQENLAFLKQQMDLVNLIKEYGLNPQDILGGMKLGLDASVPDLIDAMNEAMQAIIDAANNTLQLGSPSRLFEKFGKYVMQGFARGIDSSSALPQRAFAQSVPAMATSYTTNTGGNSYYVNNQAQLDALMRRQDQLNMRSISRKI